MVRVRQIDGESEGDWEGEKSILKRERYVREEREKGEEKKKKKVYNFCPYIYKFGIVLFINAKLF